MFLWKLPRTGIGCQMLLCLNQELWAGSVPLVGTMRCWVAALCRVISYPGSSLFSNLDWLLHDLQERERKLEQPEGRTENKAQKKIIYNWLPVRSKPCLLAKSPPNIAYLPREVWANMHCPIFTASFNRLLLVCVKKASIPKYRENSADFKTYATKNYIDITSMFRKKQDKCYFPGCFT